MLRAYLGQIGHYSIIFAFITSLIATYAYFLSSRDHKKEDQAFWKKVAQTSFYAHTAFIILIVASLFTIIFNKYFEYHYAWDNTSLSLPLGYAISCFWQDQEGSFLLWMFWNVILGVILILWFKNKKNENKNLGEPNDDRFFGGSSLFNFYDIGSGDLGRTQNRKYALFCF